MLLDSATLTQITTKNLISVTVSQTQLQTNFELILKALQNHEALLKDHNEQLLSMQQKITQTDLRSALEDLDKKIKVELDGVGKKFKSNAAKISKIEQSLAEMSKENPGSKGEKKDSQQSSKQMASSQLSEALRKLQQKMQKMEGEIDSLLIKVKQIDSLSSRQDSADQTIVSISSRMKEEEEAILKLQEELAKLKTEKSGSSQIRKQSGKSDKVVDYDAEIKQLNNSILSLRQQFNKFAFELTEKVETVEKNSFVSQKDKDNYEDLIKKMKKMTDDIWKLNEQLYVSDKHNREVEVTNQSKFDEIFKKIKDLEGIVDNIKSQSTSHKTIGSARQPMPSEWSPQKEYPEDLNNEQSPKKEEKDMESLNFKKDIMDKLKQQRIDFNKAIKRLDNVTIRKEEDVSKFTELEDRILKLQRQIDGKIDEDGQKKWMKYIENKVNILYQIINAEGTEEDAYIARKNWTCLSCDKKLQAYRGRVGSHLISAQLKSKGVDPEVVGGGMLFKTKSKFELPQFKK